MTNGSTGSNLIQINYNYFTGCTAGALYRISGTVSGVGGGFTKLMAYDGDVIQGIQLCTGNGAFSVTFTPASYLTNWSYMFLYANGVSGPAGLTYGITNIVLTRVGALFFLCPNESGDGIGYQIHDMGTNAQDAVVPTAGWTWTGASRTGFIRYTTSTNGNQQILGQQCLPGSIRLDSWVDTLSTGMTVYHGTASGGAQISASASLSSGANDITPLLKFPGTGNLWTNSNGTGTILTLIRYSATN